MRYLGLLDYEIEKRRGYNGLDPIGMGLLIARALYEERSKVMEIYKAEGLRGRTYYVFDRKKNKADAIAEAAKEARYAKKDMEIIDVWTNGLDLFLSPKKGAIKTYAVVRKGRK